MIASVSTMYMKLENPGSWGYMGNGLMAVALQMRPCARRHTLLQLKPVSKICDILMNNSHFPWSYEEYLTRVVTSTRKEFPHIKIASIVHDRLAA